MIFWFLLILLWIAESSHHAAASSNYTTHNTEKLCSEIHYPGLKLSVQHPNTVITCVDKPIEMDFDIKSCLWSGRILSIQNCNMNWKEIRRSIFLKNEYTKLLVELTIFESEMIETALSSSDKNVSWIDFLDEVYLESVFNLELKHNYITEIGNYNKSCPNLVSLDLSHNRIVHIQSQMLEYGSLQRIVLSHNRITTLDFTPNVSIGIVLLFLDYNNLLEPVIDWIDWYRLKTLHVEGNRMKNFYFNNLNSVTLLNVGNNSIANFPWDIALYPSLETVLLDHNMISTFNISKLNTFPKLMILDLSYNNIHTLDLNRNLGHTNLSMLEINLENNQIKKVVGFYQTSETPMEYPELILLDNNSFECDDQNLEWLLHLQTNLSKISMSDLLCKTPDRLYGRQFETLKPNELWRNMSADPSCPKDCNCDLITYEKQMIVNCTHRNLIQIPNLPVIPEANSTVLHIEHNQLKHLPNQHIDTVPKGYNLVTVLFANNNIIEGISESNIMTNMTSVHFDFNKITSVDFSRFPKTLRNLTLLGNPIECDCQFQLKILSQSFTNSCANGTIITKKHYSTMCLNQTVSTTVIVVSCAVTAVALIAVIFGILLWYYRRSAKLSSYKLSSFLMRDSEMKHDVFLCYQHRDLPLIRDEILFKLEAGPPALKVCIAERDWLGGTIFTDMIVESVAFARRIVFVVSLNFLDSRYTRMEFVLAHRRALRENRNRVIVILCDPIDQLLAQSGMYNELRYHLEIGRNVVRWDDARFWRQLRAKIDPTKQ